MATQKKPSRTQSNKVPFTLGSLEGIDVPVERSTASHLFGSMQEMPFKSRKTVIGDIADETGVEPNEEVQALIAEEEFRSGLNIVPLALGNCEPAGLSWAANALCVLALEGWEKVCDELRELWFRYSVPIVWLVKDEDQRENLGGLLVEKSASDDLKMWLTDLILVCRGWYHQRLGEVAVAIRHGRLVADRNGVAPEIKEAALSLLILCYQKLGSDIEYKGALLDWLELLTQGGSPGAQAANINIKGVNNPWAEAKEMRILEICSDLAILFEEEENRDTATKILSDLCAHGYGNRVDSRYDWIRSFADRRLYGSVAGLLPEGQDPATAPVNIIHFNPIRLHSDAEELNRILDNAWRVIPGTVNGIMLGPIEQREAIFVIGSTVAVTADFFGQHLTGTMADMGQNGFQVDVRTVNNGAATSMVVVSHSFEIRQLGGVCLAVEPIQVNSEVELAVSALVFPGPEPSEGARQHLTEVLSTKIETLPGFLAFSNQALAAIREAGRRLRGAHDSTS